MSHGGKDWLERNRVGLLVVVVAVTLVGVVTPSRPPWNNALRWRVPGPGVEFPDIGQALSERPIVSRTGELTVEVWLAPGFIPVEGNQEIISFYDEQMVRPLLLGQFQRGFLLRGRADNPRGDPRRDSYIGIHEVGLSDARALQHLAVTVTAEGARLHVNGNGTRLTLPATIAREGEPFGGRLMLGSSNTGWRVWLGSMLGVAIYERVLAPAELRLHAEAAGHARAGELLRDPTLLALYRFEEGRGDRTHSAAAGGPDLTFPDRMTRPTRRNFLSNNSIDPRDRGWLRKDITLNILGFMPLGFVLAWKKPAHSIGLALAAGFAFSLSIEMVQALIPGRDSSLIDLASNSVGALVGALLSRIGSLR